MSARSGPSQASPVQRTWHEAAVRFRAALRELDYDMPDCLPGERDRGDCDGSAAEHAMSYLGALVAVLEHKLAHTGPAAEPFINAARDHVAGTLAEQDAMFPCGRDHVH